MINLLQQSDSNGPENDLVIDEVWIVPCGYRKDKPMISEPKARLDMLRLGVQDFFPKEFPVKVDPIEVDNG